MAILTPELCENVLNPPIEHSIFGSNHHLNYGQKVYQKMGLESQIALFEKNLIALAEMTKTLSNKKVTITPNSESENLFNLAYKTQTSAIQFLNQYQGFYTLPQDLIKRISAYLETYDSIFHQTLVPMINNSKESDATRSFAHDYSHYLFLRKRLMNVFSIDYISAQYMGSKK